MSIFNKYNYIVSSLIKICLYVYGYTMIIKVSIKEKVLINIGYSDKKRLKVDDSILTVA